MGVPGWEVPEIARLEVVYEGATLNIKSCNADLA
jgi:hypothetical protein